MNIKDGVFKATKKNGSVYYRSSLTFHRKHISLGSFTSEEAAHNAYLEACELLRGKEIKTINDYTKTASLSFEKWVILLNLRVNKVYFQTPIFLRTNFFYYYYSPEVVLKFDIDDLFYFSSHKIMKRGNHYFVADFGNQENILNRFDIKNYAVLSRDYQFRNCDVTDFRRENLIIHNKYHGVVIENKKNTIAYITKIHINGNIKVGVYQTMVEAAIAYNKAIDILKRNGIKKNYTANYIEEIPAATYAELYMNLKVSPKLYKLHFSE